MFIEISKITVLAERVIKNWRSEPSKFIKKSIKNDAEFYQFFDLFFNGFSVDVGPMLGPQIHLKSIKNPFKNHFKQCWFVWLILCWFMLIFDDFLGSSWGPRGGAGAGSKALFSLLGPRWAQEPPRAHQDPSSQEPPRALQDGFGDRFLVDFWSILNVFLIDFR